MSLSKIVLFSLIKMLYYMCEQSGQAPTWPQLEHAIKRNFGGLDCEDCNPFEEFTKQIPKQIHDTAQPVLTMSQIATRRVRLGGDEGW